MTAHLTLLAKARRYDRYAELVQHFRTRGDRFHGISPKISAANYAEAARWLRERLRLTGRLPQEILS